MSMAQPSQTWCTLAARVFACAMFALLAGQGRAQGDASPAAGKAAEAHDKSEKSKPIFIEVTVKTASESQLRDVKGMKVVTDGGDPIPVTPSTSDPQSGKARVPLGAVKKQTLRLLVPGVGFCPSEIGENKIKSGAVTILVSIQGAQGTCSVQD